MAQVHGAAKMGDSVEYGSYEAPPSYYNPYSQDPMQAEAGGVPPTAPQADAPPPMTQAQKTKLLFNETEIRANFIKKVFFIVTLMLALVVVEVLIGQLIYPVNKWLRCNSVSGYYGNYCSSSWVMIGCIVAFLVVYMVLACAPNLRKTFPVNIILTMLLALFLGFFVSQMCSFYEVDSILICVVLLVICCASITIFSVQTRFDMLSGPGIAILLFVYAFWLVVASVSFIHWYHSHWTRVLYAVLACTLFMLYLAIDIQLIVGGHRIAISPEEYILAAVQIFVDVVYIFIYLLAVFGIGKR